MAETSSRSQITLLPENEQRVALLKHKREFLKKKLTHFESFLRTGSLDGRTDELRLRLQGVKNSCVAFDEVQLELGRLEPEGNHDEEQVAFDASFFPLVAEAERLVCPGTAIEPALNRIDSLQSIGQCSQTQLPRLTLPKFSGEYVEWEGFRDMFQSIIHNNASITNVQKLQYLKCSLIGEAYAILDNIQVTDANYEHAWHLLQDRYKNEPLILHNHLQALHSLPSASRESANELKRIRDSTLRVIGAIKNLQREANFYDDWLVFQTVGRLDSASRRDWETSRLTAQGFATFPEVLAFLDNRIRALEAITVTREPSTSTGSKRTSSGVVKQHWPNARVHAITASGPHRPCPSCGDAHYLGRCAQYLAMSATEKMDTIQRQQVCRNCLYVGHQASSCPSVRSCFSCGRRHHSTIHYIMSTKDSHPRPTSMTSRKLGTSESTTRDDRANPTELSGTEITTATHTATTRWSPPVNPTATSATHSGSPQLNSFHISSTEPRMTPILLATARITLHSSDGRRCSARALVDSGSERSFISENIAQQLRLRRQQTSIPITGIGSSNAGRCKHIVQVNIEPHFSHDTQVPLEAFVLSRLTSPLPSTTIPNPVWPHLDGLTLADPYFTNRSQIDVILGADVYSTILLPGIRKGSLGTPIAQHTSLGWILSGPADHNRCNTPSSNSKQVTPLRAYHASCDTELATLLRQFWELEDLPQRPFLSPADQECEQHFIETHQRTNQGQYIVRLPIRNPLPTFSDSARIATQCLKRLENRRHRDRDLSSKYTHFMGEYHQLGHMESVSSDARDDTVYYMPHHGVFRPGDASRKLRVVFNASQRGSSGLSLNDCLHTGTALQNDLVTVILRWRKYAVVFTTDIEKMYRQILVDPRDRDLQRIVWRHDTTKPIEHFRLTTVTYGTACAPYLALRTIRQLAQDEQSRFPEGAEILRKETYVDDTLSGGDDIPTAVSKMNQLIQISRAGHFELRKWATNRQELLEHIPSEWLQPEAIRAFPTHDHLRTLGLEWEPAQDLFLFRLMLSPCETPITKRHTLSVIAKIFDPLGWVAPVTIRMKTFMQDLWLANLDWDTSLPDALTARWESEYAHSLSSEPITIPRWIGHRSGQHTRELHGFADASQRAYAACVYVRTEQPDGGFMVHLLVAKTKVAPVKQVSIPRLELCGAVLLSRLMLRVQQDLEYQGCATHAWTDSQVTLAWITGHPSRWSTFVANRVSDIQTILPDARWRHVSSADNPADVGSRGSTSEELKNHQLWWHGPAWLRQSPSKWPVQLDLPDIQAESRRPVQTYTVTKQGEWDLIQHYSSLTKLLRITAFCQRFTENLRKGSGDRQLGSLTAKEIDRSRTYWIHQAQHLEFATEISALSTGQAVSRRSTILRLHPFLDSAGTLRVGGRLRHANLMYNVQHPVILPKTSSLVKLLVANAHLSTLHGGTTATMGFLLQRYWIIGGRTIVRSHIHRCITCFRSNPQPGLQMMGNLPPARVIPARPFLRAGLDYAGPIQLRTTKGRGHRTYKGYICLFICMVTKAIHLEVASDYSSQAFLAAYKRFTGRRGICAELWSDNGTNFHGAQAELRALFAAATQHWNAIADLLANDGTTWHFIPPAAPHFGGLWEAGIKSAKRHLSRIVHNTTFTFEEFTTLLVQVEACLNSRPIGPLSNDPADLEALTPGHFLIGAPLNAVPEPSLLDVPVNRLTRWQLTRQLTEHFWRRWTSEYLHQLQQRPKWAVATKNARINDLVLLKEDHMPPSKWRLGRIVSTHPGSDGLTRVVTIRTSNSSIKRPITKICVLPMSED